jgi:hypothetical protein
MLRRIRNKLRAWWECHTKRCTYYEHYLAYGPAELTKDSTPQNAEESSTSKTADITARTSAQSVPPGKNASAPDAETSTEERARTRKTRKKLAGVDAILPDKRIPAEPGAPIL